MLNVERIQERRSRSALLYTLFFQVIHLGGVLSVRCSILIVQGWLSIAIRIADYARIQQGEYPINLQVQFIIVRLQFFNLGL